LVPDGRRGQPFFVRRTDDDPVVFAELESAENHSKGEI
jgi:hypothetical protein